MVSLLLWSATVAETDPGQASDRDDGTLAGADGAPDQEAVYQQGPTQSCDWSVGDPFKMHFPQLPDESGWDVNATVPQRLAEDFLCTESGYINEIHFWGSWKGDNVGDIMYFQFGFYENIPENPPGQPYSRPGALLWEMTVGIDSVEVVPVDPPGMEGWYDPSTGEVIPNDHGDYFQYNVCFSDWLPPWDLFHQHQDSIYWLSIMAEVSPVGTYWGWKNSREHWMDDAVWQPFDDTLWYEIYEPGPLLADTNRFWIELGDDGIILDAGGTHYYDDGTSYSGWFYYPNTDWRNIWFYDHPFDPDGYKLIDIYFEWYPTDPYYWIEVAANWSTADWPPGNPPPVPPLTPAEENLYIEREYLELYPPGMQQFGVLVPDYCPEWVSFDIMGQNVIIEAGLYAHECISIYDSLSLDLAFVIAGVAGCCAPPIRGNVDYDPFDEIVISDMVYLVDYMFNGGPAPECVEEANIDGNCCANPPGESPSDIDIADLVYLVDYMFIGGPEPAACP